MIARLVVVFAVLATTAAFALWWRRREGRFGEATGLFDPRELGLARGSRPNAVLVEFWGEGCAPCKVVQARIEKITAELPDVSVVQIDAGARLDLADRYGVKRVPTLFVTDGSLKILWRASGVPSEDAIKDALLGPDWAGRPHPLPAEPSLRVFHNIRHRRAERARARAGGV